MKVAIYKIILTFTAICSIYSISLKYNLRNEASTEGLTFYQMALHAKSHSHEDPVDEAAATPAAPTPPSATGKLTSAVGALKLANITVDATPWEITQCDQVLMITAQRIANFDDYTTRAPGFYTMSAYVINMFESKDNNKLLESINLGHIKSIPIFLQGSKDCTLFLDDISKRNITFCSEDYEEIDAIDNAYNSFMSCRMGEDLKQFDPVTINNVLTASCNGFNSTSGVEYDMPAIRAKMASELRESGFEVADTSTSGAADFGVGNFTSGDATVPTPSRKIDLRVPGTH